SGKVQDGDRTGGLAIRLVHGARQLARERQADAGRKPGRPRWTLDFLCRARESAGREGPSATHRRLYSRTAVLPGLGADLETEHYAGGAARSDQHRSALARPVENQRPTVEHAAVRRRVRLQTW